MKELQRNYTTPEQSQILIELGIPLDSADMYYARMKHDDFELPKVIWECYSKSTNLHPYVFTYLPCWSVGRLMEIYDTCFKYPESRSSWCAITKLSGVPYVNYVLDAFQKAASDNLLDFSKIMD